jgi:hypothetical protein
LRVDAASIACHGNRGSLMSTVPIACSLSADQLRCSADRLLPGLARDASRVARTADGARLEFDPVPGIVPRLADVVERERQCCRFLHFVIEVPEAGGPVSLELSGPPGTGDFLASLGPELRSAAD